MFLTRISKEAKTNEFASSVRVRDAARRAFIAVDTIRDFAGPQSLPLVLTG